MKTILTVALLVTLVSATARAQINAGELKPEPSLPFTHESGTSGNADSERLHRGDKKQPYLRFLPTT
jgi:hypothetical protein